MISDPITFAHGVGRVYESPLPVWLYGLGAALTVLLSFVLRAVVRSEPHDREPRVLLGPRGARVLTLVLRYLALGGLGLALVAGIVVRDRGLSFTPLWFWIVLIIGTTALSAVVDGVWRAMDPWAAVERFYRVEGPGRISTTPPWWIGPVGLYALFWFELVSGVGFDAIAIVLVLLLYTLFYLTFRSRWGPEWGESDPLTRLFSFAGSCAPMELRDEGLVYRGWLVRLDTPTPLSKGAFACVFILLGATTLDNVREMTAWHGFLVSARVGDVSPAIVDSLALLVFAGLFLVPYALAMAVTVPSLPAGGSVRSAMQGFARSLVPIGVAYLLAHNAPLLMTGTPRLIQYLSDPFERGWNLLGTATAFGDYLPSPRVVWFIEIAVIIGGHVLGVLAAHRIAARRAGSHARAVRSQIALTVLMSFFTITTLFLLGQPLVA